RRRCAWAPSARACRTMCWRAARRASPSPCGRAPSRSTSPPPPRSRASGYLRSPCRRTPHLLERIETIRGEAVAAIEAASSTAELEELRVRYLGRKAELTGILRGIGELPPERRGEVGGAANRARKELEA